MPEMMGFDFLVESRKTHPNASRILVTAVLALPTIVEAINRGEIFRFVAKPWLREELLATVRNAIQRHDLIVRNEVLQARSQSSTPSSRVANSQLEGAGEGAGERAPQARRRQQANSPAATNSSLELCRRILTAYDPILGGRCQGAR